jgi:hypothetical protein
MSHCACAVDQAARSRGDCLGLFRFLGEALQSLNYGRGMDVGQVGHDNSIRKVIQDYA